MGWQAPAGGPGPAGGFGIGYAVSNVPPLLTAVDTFFKFGCDSTRFCWVTCIHILHFG